MTTIGVSIKIDQETKERYKNLAVKKNRSAHWMMREAINQYLDREEKRESFHQDAVNSWNEYQDQGRDKKDHDFSRKSDFSKAQKNPLPGLLFLSAG